MTPRQSLVLDAFAILALFGNEPAAPRVDALLRSGDGLYMSSINLGEVFYKSMREEGLAKAQDLLTSLETFPIEVIDPDRDLVLSAAYLKGLHPISYADCFAAALAMRMDATLVTGDRDFERLRDELTIEWLPSYKA